MGDVVNIACHMANKAGRDGRDTIIVTKQVYDNLNEHHQGLLSSYTDEQYTRYEGNIINTAMDEWYKQNCK